ncbi:MAG: hypothetical protein LBG05_04770, partial [Treponema sp.]|nr:hypothetical protein [Treponema sp.]
WGNNTVYWGNNTVYWGNNTVYWGNNTVYWGNNTVYWGNKKFEFLTIPFKCGEPDVKAKQGGVYAKQ